MGCLALLAGVALVSLGAYSYLRSNHPGAPFTLVYRPDPGGVYDRPPGRAAVLGATATPGPPAAATPLDPLEPPLGEGPFRLVIDRIGVDADVFTYGLDENRVPQVPLNPWDVAWYDFSAKPGTGGNAVFAGHVTWNGRAVFFDLDRLASGDIIRLIGRDGTQLAYIVTDVYLVDPNDKAALSVMGPAEEDVITIVTCGGTFFRTDDPVFGGDYTNRLIVRAALSGVQAGSGSAAGPGG